MTCPNAAFLTAVTAGYSTASESEATKAQHEEEVKQLMERLNASSPSTSPLMVLKHLVEAFFAKGPFKASHASEALCSAIVDDHMKLNGGKAIIELSNFDRKTDDYYATLLAWYPSFFIASLVLFLAAPPNKAELLAAAKSQSSCLGGRPTFHTVRSQPSASLRTAFQTAKAAALGPQSLTTVMVVEIVDAHWLEAREKTPNDHLNFGHVFTLALGREGVVIWQSWGKPGAGYLFQEYLTRAGGRLRDWKEGEDFVGKFEKWIVGKVNPTHHPCWLLYAFGG